MSPKEFDLMMDFRSARKIVDWLKDKDLYYDDLETALRRAEKHLNVG